MKTDADKPNAAAVLKSTADAEWNEAAPAMATAVTATKELPAATRCGKAENLTRAGMAKTAPPMPQTDPSVPDAKPIVRGRDLVSASSPTGPVKGVFGGRLESGAEGGTDGEVSMWRRKGGVSFSSGRVG